MAAPAHRRSGHSRKAQYSLFLAYVAGGVGAAIGAILVIVSIGNPQFMSSLRGAGAEAAAPVSRVAAGSKARSLSLVEEVEAYFVAGSQNAKLRRELEEAKVQLVEARAQAEENRRLKALLGLMQENPKPVITTRLIGSTSTSTRRLATLDAGSRQGVRIGMPVRSPTGLVGRVLELSPNTSRVLLVTDGESVVPVRRAADGIPAFAQGRSDGRVQLRLIDLGVNPLKPGDTFVTSGSGGLYRPGTPVAIVVEVTSDGAIARLFSDPAANDYVVVDRTWTEQVEPAAAKPAAP